MAKRITTGKRDREKLKEQKRKDERKSGGTSSFEDMIAYVDENGILHTTPQDVKPKTEIDVSQIEISTPKQEEMEILPSTGRVEYFTASKGYGFIKDADSGEKYFFHISSAPDTIAEGDKVTFEIERGTRGLAAVRISIINKQSLKNKNDEHLCFTPELGYERRQLAEPFLTVRRGILG